MKKLVIVESPAKAKTIQKYLGAGYVVKSSKGHIVDLPKSGLAVDVDKDYEPTYTVTKPSVVKELKSALKGADALVLAVDPDREGEAIGWHVAQQLGVIDKAGRKKSKDIDLERIVFTEITESAVKEAAASPRKLNMDLVSAQQARRVLDRLVGYKLSPLLWKKIRYGLSAGRVQSVAVRLIVDRENEREAFKADEYWSVKSYLLEKEAGKTKTRIITKAERDAENEKLAEAAAKKGGKVEKELPNGIPFDLTLIKGKKAKLATQEATEKVLSDVEDARWIVDSTELKTTKKNPRPPFSTSVLQQAAVNRMGFNARRTMQVAQKLYEAGHITYMRTDSISMSGQAVAAARKLIEAEYGAKYLPEKPVFYKTRSKVAQEAHEAIRPTNFAKNASALKLDGDESKLYTLIRNRALASQMAAAELESNTIKIQVGDYTFQNIGKRIVFDGYLKVYSEKVSEVELPVIKNGQELFANEIEGSQHFTQPPPRYTEASLIKELENLGIGRPSTYAPIIHTIQQRKYVEKDGRYFLPTDVGKVVTALLVKYFSDIVDVDFTSGMEDKLDDIANGDSDWVKMMDEFYKPFDKKLVQEEKNITRDEFTVLGHSDEKCPICGKSMDIKLGKYGRFLSCSDWPNCKGMMSIDGETEEDIAAKPESDEFKETYKPAPKTDDGRDYILKAGRFGEFWAHPDYPKVKDAQPLILTDKKLEEKYGNVPKTDDGRAYLIKRGRFGEFWAHPDYPKVKHIIRIKKQKAETESLEE